MILTRRILIQMAIFALVATTALLPRLPLARIETLTLMREA